MNRFLIIIIIILDCNYLWALKPLPKDISTEGEEVMEEEFIPETGFEVKEEPPPKEIIDAIEIERQMKEEVIQQKKAEEIKEEEPSKGMVQKPILKTKTISKGPSLPQIIAALIILLVSFFVYRSKPR